MKKITTFTFLLMTVALMSNAQNIPNPSFENWQSYSLGELPTSWNTSDSLTFANGAGHSAVKEGTDHCHLTFAIKLISCGIGFIAAPGVATNGIISGTVSSYTISGGSPDTARSRSFNGCLKYNPSAGTDKAVISAFLFRWNSVAGTRDTVAFSIDSVSSTPAMTTFNNEFIYRDYVNQPDTVLILLQSSPGLFNASIGSALIVDNLTLSGWVGINEANSPVKSMQIFPMPANQELNVNVELNKAIMMNYEIMDNNGKLIASGKMNGLSQKIDISSMAIGNYFIALLDEEGRKLSADKFTIVR
jgi:hypothetical protein